MNHHDDGYDLPEVNNFIPDKALDQVVADTVSKRQHQGRVGSCKLARLQIRSIQSRSASFSEAARGG
jgi:hypothetical protein